MRVIAILDIQYLVIPLIDGNNIEKLIVSMNTEQIEVLVNANRAQLVTVPYRSNVDLSDITIRAVHEDGIMDNLYEPSDINFLPDNEWQI